ncbi:MAG: ribosomal RNA small subunit methyltransferase A [Candidatus Omnitrophica bacterium]|nr:ribosomal RNA small subunit methyltransferase A [Candidatus Omnitrophota bacterium]
MNAREIKGIIRQYNLGISPRRMGQNFLVDPKALTRIVEAIGPTPSDRVLEVGAGLGALTRGLLDSGAAVVAVERDPKFIKVLSDRFKGAKGLQIVHSDILAVDLSRYAGGEEKSLLLVGNIPYSMTSPILEFLLRQRKWVKRALLTVQKEVAQRIIAHPGTKEYSSITLLVQVAFKPSIAFTIHPGCFYPQPKVTSAVLRLEALSTPVVPPEEEEGVLKLSRALFSHRRKTLLNALVMAGMGFEKEEVLASLKRGGVDPTRRLETFDIKEVTYLNQLLRGCKS